MMDCTFRRSAAVEFGTAREAQHWLAGVPVAARIAREVALARFTDLWIAVTSGGALDPQTMAEIHRLAPSLTVHDGSPPDGAADHFPPDQLIAADAIPDFLAGQEYAFTRLDSSAAAAAILRQTGKATDGAVSRWLNRPISRQLSEFLLRLSGLRPIHATLGTAAIGAAMFASLLFGGRSGLITGALLFQGASIFDGVDGEIARSTFRTSRLGAALDSAVDMATNVAAVLGLAVNLALRGQRSALPLVTWGVVLLLIGLAMIGRRSLRDTGSITFDGVKQRYRGRAAGPLASRLMTLATLGTSRDFCALLYLVLVLVGIPIAGLYLFAVVTPVWIVFVTAALWPLGGKVPAFPERSA
jgi:CDP-L-myo-inositol myo-inositolphosphotransferase